MTRSGLILDGRYRLDVRIAAGGVGQVWRATDLLLQRPVAVKVLRPEYSDHPETLDRFRKEARHAGAISNAHVAQVYDYGPAGPGWSPYLVMEFVDGPSLADLLAVDPLDPVRALDIVSQAAAGLAAAHRAGLVHRDIKPGNILISREGQVKVTDFGIAHAVGHAPVTGPGLVMGTTQYIAPERIAGSQGTAASDVYALGIVLHECLTGVPPHDGAPAEVMAAHLYLPLPPLPSGTPPEFEDLVARLTAKDPAQRLSDARELSEAAALLRDSLSGVPHVPPARTRAHTAAGPVTGSPVPRTGALAAEPMPAMAGPGQASPADYTAVYGAGADGAARGAGTTALPPWDGYRGPATSRQDEWRAPERMPMPVGSWPAGQPEPSPRQRAKALAVSAAAVAAAGLIALLASGLFNSAPDANQVSPWSPISGSPAAGSTVSPGASKSGTASPSATTPPVSPAQQATTAGRSPSASPSVHPSGSPSASPSPGTPSASPSGAPSTSPSAAPSSSSPGHGHGHNPSPSPTATCVLVCL